MINKLPRNILVEDIIRDAPLQQERQLPTLIAQLLHKRPLPLAVVGIINKLVIDLILSVRSCVFSCCEMTITVGSLTLVYIWISMDN